jgi:hypothetical protein
LKKGYKMPTGWKFREIDRDGKHIMMGFVKDPNGIWVGVVSGI